MMTVECFISIEMLTRLIRLHDRVGTACTGSCRALLWVRSKKSSHLDSRSHHQQGVERMIVLLLTALRTE